MEVAYQPYIDPEYDSLIERIYPASVSIDNETYQDCTLVKVDSANKNGILLEMVQVLTDLDLVISKSYISSDGEWFMDVFHVTDQTGNKLKDQGLILYIQQALCATRRASTSKEIKTSTVSQFPSWHGHMPSDHTAIEMTGTDSPGLLSEISAVLAELSCRVVSAAAWTHHTRAACILYIEDNGTAGPITDPTRLAQITEVLENVVEAHDRKGERRSLRLTAPVAGWTHTERRLHQLMYADRDYEMCCGCCGGIQCGDSKCAAAHVSIESWKDKGYSVVNVRSRDRPKLLFDTVCVLTDMQYIVFHAAVSSEGSIAKQEYFIRHKDGWTMNSDMEKETLAQCFLAAIERRVSHGLRLDVSAKDRPCLLSDVTRTLRENGLTIMRADLTTRGQRAVGSFYVAGMSGQEVDRNTVETVRKEIGETVCVVSNNICCSSNNRKGSWRRTLQGSCDGNKIDYYNNRINNHNNNNDNNDKSRLSLGGILWAHIEKFSSSFGPIRL
ncbi:hypothetical protein MLD38_009288 [Melastoma candidum]|uniref:Uncharacterized protein n=1 Tax=Melastoma candidum TaxID=119954 RepID=A0ACB9RX99_9MYRT|nr:hypothetical protein MLD38_009288 [Melastoma candidum]